MEFGGKGGAPSGDLVEHTFGIKSQGFTKVLATLTKGRWVQAPRELFLLVLEDVRRGFSTSGASTPRLEALSAPRRTY